MMATESTWTVKPLLDLVTLRRGQVDPRTAANRGLPLIAPDHIESGTGRLLEIRTAEQQGAISGKYLVDPGDIIYSKIRPYLRKVYLAEFPALCSADMYPLKPRPGVDASFIVDALLGRDFTNFAVGVSMRSGIPKINRAELAEYELAAPPPEEQKAIGRALADVDRLIGSLQRLVAKKRDVKQAMMQELLTGRVRLPGYGGAWIEQPVSEILEFKNGLNKASQFFGHGTPIVNFMDVMRTPVITADRVKGLVNLSRDEISRFSARRGDMFFTRTSESVDEIGTAAVLVDDIRGAVFSGFVLRGRPIAPVNTTFLAYQFQLPSVRRQVVATASYTTRALTNGGSLGRVRVLVPSSDEQASVAAVVADADAELAALERRLESARAIKQGMVQELLTGRTRLPVEDAS